MAQLEEVRSRLQEVSSEVDRRLLSVTQDEHIEKLLLELQRRLVDPLTSTQVDEVVSIAEQCKHQDPEVNENEREYKGRREMALESTAILARGDRSVAIIFSYFDCEFGSHCTWEKEDGMVSLSWLADVDQTSTESEGTVLLGGRTLWKVLIPQRTLTCNMDEFESLREELGLHISAHVLCALLSPLMWKHAFEAAYLHEEIAFQHWEPDVLTNHLLVETILTDMENDSKSAHSWTASRSQKRGFAATLASASVPLMDAQKKSRQEPATTTSVSSSPSSTSLTL
eukprot:CAMPEP_0177630814 /NCGR_PEP_ID=MMETSP0447-20121125/1410_1 /TAXON_ID=0 /ORGANISM="Stygamoeba regulata, Strain BSH-02190019" /LENGTH=283 /DNA_ID=CAMNT_0019132243 /DNA_START=158 /DNA_END=1009 /DNA_ORIENTATION=+